MVDISILEEMGLRDAQGNEFSEKSPGLEHIVGFADNFMDPVVVYDAAVISDPAFVGVANSDCVILERKSVDAHDHEHMRLEPADLIEPMAFLGWVKRGDVPCMAYSYSGLLKHFVKNDGMSHEEAEEWISYNTASAYHGDGTWVIVNDGFYFEDEE